MTKIKKIGILSLAKLQGMLMAFFGLIAGIIFAIMGATVGALAGAGGLGAIPGLLAIVILPAIYGILGFITGAIGAFLYNLIAGWIGGIEIELEE